MIPDPSNLKVLIVAEHASAKWGGEAILPLHYFRHLRERGVEVLLADFVPTDRNGVIVGLFPSLGFEAQGPSTSTAAPARFRLGVAGYSPRPTHIRRKIQP